MPWRATSPMEERIGFVRDCRSGLYEIKERCERYGISRKTGYKWLARFDAEGPAGLEERSRAPHHCEHRTSEPIRRAIIDARLGHPTWGPRKLRAWLAARRPHVPWPAVSSVGELLRREGLVSRRRQQRRREPHPGPPQIEATEPNDLWTVDFKGEFATRSGWWCYPLTVLDHASRLCLALEGLSSTQGARAQLVFERAFREFGLPTAILSDNGPPFASPHGRCGLTQLSVWWLRLGIRRIRTEPASPEQNGAHERFHRTLKAETSKPPAGDQSAQQRRFNRFRTVYNDERPHEALGQAPPASRYRPSPRPFPRQVPEPEYPTHYRIRLLNGQGGLLFKGECMHVSKALAHQRIGMEEIDDGIWSIYFCHERLAHYDERTRKVQR